MQKYVVIVLTLIFSLVGVWRCNAQEVNTIFPTSPPPIISIGEEHPIELEPLDRSKLEAEDREILARRGVSPIGRVRDVNYDIKNSGGLYLAHSHGGTFHWEQGFRCENATALSLYFSDIDLKEGEHISVRANSEVIEINSSESGKAHFATPLLKGNELLVTYHGDLDREKVPFKIVGIGVGYLTSSEDTQRGGGDCHVDINCSEGDNWQEQRDAVVRLLINEGGVQFTCSGTLMNNTLGDQRRLVLSALHCMSETTDAELETAVVTFNYERPNCNSGFAPEINFLVGVERLADSNDAVDGESNPSGSDFVLVEIDDEIPAEWNPYWAGWNALNQASSFGRTIHHPNGDPKKISTYNTITVSSNIGGPGSHWGVQWISTTNGHGVTAPGSSGSPLFNANGLVIGTLTGGFSACEESGNNGPDGTDYYGKFSYHWLNNPNAADQKLSVWLDPLNTGVTSLEGSYNPVMSVSEEEISSVQVTPTLASDIIHISDDNLHKTWFLEVFDLSGKTVFAQTSFIGKVSVDVSALNKSIYLVKLTDNQGLSVCKKILKN